MEANNNIEKKKINVIIADGTRSSEYIDFLNLRYDVTVVEAHKVAKKDVDLLLFTGGEDVNPEMYGQAVGKYTSFSRKRDDIEREVFKSYFGVPCLGICRGAQLLTVLNGGKLIQHVNGHGTSHDIFIEGYGNNKITSTHHQMMFPYNLYESNYQLLGYSTYFQSNTYLNGDNNEVEKDSNFLEAEIVFYKQGKSLCIQGHPEYGSCDPNTTNICLDLIDKYLFNSSKDNDSKYKYLKQEYDYEDDYEDDDKYDYTWAEEQAHMEQGKVIEGHSVDNMIIGMDPNISKSKKSSSLKGTPGFDSITYMSMEQQMDDQNFKERMDKINWLSTDNFIKNENDVKENKK